MDAVTKINCVIFCLPVSCLYLMRISYFGDRKVRVGRMENRHVGGRIYCWKYKGFFSGALSNVGTGQCNLPV